VSFFVVGEWGHHLTVQEVLFLPRFLYIQFLVRFLLPVSVYDELMEWFGVRFVYCISIFLALLHGCPSPGSPWLHTSMAPHCMYAGLHTDPQQLHGSLHWPSQVRLMSRIALNNCNKGKFEFTRRWGVV
jgi:hypothetical protein